MALFPFPGSPNNWPPAAVTSDTASCRQYTAKLFPTIPKREMECAAK